ncbi:cytochrome c peroxidase [Sulfurovum sp.]|uniref:cytochrome-c peroxidase n=1 Tax=Sulfurovum sp. TaxID=1969726 RepID=UPI0026394300|nr:cytochrome c peroxidase [Sulfurovum sp.]
MKKLFHPVTITFLVLMFIISLPFMLHKHTVRLTDAQLRKAAANHNLVSVPKTYEGMLKASDNSKNPLGKAKIALGKQLFFDTRLSRDNTINCASCHILNEGGDDNLPTAIGYHGRANPHHLNSPTVFNAALAKAQFWNGRAKDVEEQAGGPVQAPFEMNMTPREVEARLNADAAMRQQFETVFGDSNITFENVRKAIGAYERTLLTRGAYDRFLEGDDQAISPAAKRGMTLFVTQGCSGCHTGMSVGGQSIQKFPLRHYEGDYLGLLFEPRLSIRTSPFPFANKGGFLGRNDNLRFRVPILRNITRTAPYFHNGAVDKIEEAVRIMSKYQLGNEFTPEQIDDVVAFLKTLEGDPVPYKIK